MTSMDERVSRLEREVQEIQHVHRARANSTASALNTVHEELIEFRAETAVRLDQIDGRLDRIERLLEERLPAPPA